MNPTAIIAVVMVAILVFINIAPFRIGDIDHPKNRPILCRIGLHDPLKGKGGTMWTQICKRCGLEQYFENLPDVYSAITDVRYWNLPITEKTLQEASIYEENEEVSE